MKEIPLTPHGTTLVSDVDFPRLSVFIWHRHKVRDAFYAVRYVYPGVGAKRKRIYMHREIRETSQQVDHHNGDGLDNRRRNLRPATNAQNHWGFRRAGNGFRGIHLHQLTGKWCAQITRFYKKTYLGLYPTPEEAARAYDRAARGLFGKFATCNFPV